MPVRKTKISSEEIEKPQKDISKAKLNKKVAAIVAGILILVSLIYVYRNLFVAAIVDGKPISRLSIIQSSEKQSGKQVLESEISKLLILSEAKKKNISVSQDEIDTQISNIVKSLSGQGQTLDQALIAQSMTKQELVEQIKIQKIVEKLFSKDVTVSTKDIDDYIASNKITAPEGVTEDQLKTSVKQQLQQQKISENFQTWLADAKKSSKVNYFVNY